MRLLSWLSLPFVLMIVPLTCGTAEAQDANYWTNQYGTSAQLLGGAVVGSIQDFSATYYNPGALVFSSDSSSLLTTAAFEINSVRLTGRAGDPGTLESIDYMLSPGLLAVRFPKILPGDHMFAFSYLTRHDFTLDMSIERYNAPPGNPVDLDRSTEEWIRYQRLSELWAGITWAYPVSQRVGIGLTTYGAVRSQRTRNQAVFYAMPSGSVASNLTIYDEVNYYNVRLFWKAGVSLNFLPLRFGLTITTPSINLFGDGALNQQFSAINLPDAEGNPRMFTYAFEKSNVPTRYLSPLAVAAGTSYNLGFTALHFSMEYFSKVPRAEIFPGATLEGFDPRLPRVTQAFGSVWNFGIGLEHRLADAVSLYSSYTTDRSAIVPETDNRLAIASWNIHHLTFGTSLNILSSYLTIGASYSFGKAPVDRFVNLPPTEEFKSIREGAPRLDSGEYARLRIQFGITIQF